MGNKGKFDAYKDLSKAGKKADSEFAESLLKIIAVGVIGGLAVILGAKKLGEEIQDAQEKFSKEKGGKK